MKHYDSNLETEVQILHAVTHVDCPVKLGFSPMEHRESRPLVVANNSGQVSAMNNAPRSFNSGAGCLIEQTAVDDRIFSH